MTALLESAEGETKKMLPDRVSNPGPLALESDALPTALRGIYCKLIRIFQKCSLIWVHTACLDMPIPILNEDSVPAGTCYKSVVIFMSMRRDDVASTSIQHHFNTICPLG